MSTVPDTIYPSLPAILSQGGGIDRFTPEEEEIELAERKCRGIEARIFFLTLLKTSQRIGYFLPLAKVPRPIAEHISLIFGVNYEGVEWAAYDASGTRQRHIVFIREHLGLRRFDSEAKAILDRLFRTVAESREDINDFIDAAVEELSRHGYELPAQSTISDQARQVRFEVNRRYLGSVSDALGPERHRRIDDLLIDEEGDGPFKLWNRVKKDPGAATLKTLREIVGRLRWLQSLDVHHARFFEGIPESKMERFAEEARSLDASRMWNLNDDRRATIGAAMVRRQIGQSLDDLGALVVKRVRVMHAKAREALRDFLWEKQNETDRLVQTLQTILETWQTTPESKRERAVEPLIGPDLERNLDSCRAHLAHARRNHFPFLWRFHAAHRAVLFEAVEALKIHSTVSGDRFEACLGFVQRHRKSHASHLPPVDEAGKPLPLDWIPERWWKFVTGEARRSETVKQVDVQAFEMAFFTHLATSLKNGDVVIADSLEYSDYREQLISVQSLPALKKEYCERLGIQPQAESFVARLRRMLAETAERVDLEFPENTDVRIEDGLPVIARQEAQILPEDLYRHEKILSDALPRHGILDILADVQEWTDFAGCFGLPSGHQSRLDDEALRAVVAVFVYGCNLGPNQAARSLPEMHRKAISNYNRDHVTLPRLKEANQLVLDAYAKLSIIRKWGSGSAVAADGTKRETYDNNLHSEYHIRYGGKGAIEYFHVSDTYAALFSSVISCSVREATYILDGLIQNESALQPDTLHADTHGQTAAAFGVAHLLGIKLMPRIKNWRHLEFCRPEPAAWYNHIDGLFRATANWDLIASEFEEMLRIVVSIQQGKLLPSVILRRFGPASRNNRTARAVRELGRVVRTIFLLEYLESADLRTVIHVNQNKVERFNQFKQFLTFGGEGLMTTNDRYEMDKRTQYARLVSNCVMLHTAGQMGDVLKKLRRRDISISDRVVGHLSPFLTAHINRFGKYELRKSRLALPQDLR